MRPRTKNRTVLTGYQRGMAAYKIGLPFTGCPYAGNAVYRKSWEDGWAEAQRKDRKRTARFRKELENLKGGR